MATKNRTSASMRDEKMKQIALMAEAGMVTASGLAAVLGCNERTIYRYVARMRDLGIQIKGEPGCGYWISPEKKVATTAEGFGVELVSFIMSRQPACMQGGSAEVGVTLGALAASMGGILAGVQHFHGRATMLQILDYYQTKIFNDVTDVAQKGVLYAADKPAGAQGAN